MSAYGKQIGEARRWHSFERFLLHSLCSGLVLLVLFDWLFDFEIIFFPFSKYLRVFLLVICLFYLIISGIRFGKYGYLFGGVFSYFLALNLIYAIVSNDVVGNLYHCSRIAFWLLAAVVTYRLIIFGYLTEEALQKIVFATIILGSTFTIYFMTMSGAEAGQNASAYLLVWCLPLLLMANKSQLNSIFLALAVLAILLTVKRGAMIALGLSILSYGLVYIQVQQRLRAFLRIAGLFCFLTIVFVYGLSLNWEAIQLRFEDTSGSGRDQMYSMLLDHWLDADFVNFVLGFGINSVQQYTGFMFSGISGRLGPYAHSDWVQMAHDFGLLGIGFLVWLHIRVLLLIRLSYRIRHPYTPSLAMGYVILFLVNIYSGHLMSPNAVYFGLLLAYANAAIHLNVAVPGRAR